MLSSQLQTAILTDERIPTKSRIFQDSKFTSQSNRLLALASDAGGTFRPMAFAVVSTKVA